MCATIRHRTGCLSKAAVRIGGGRWSWLAGHGRLREVSRGLESAPFQACSRWKSSSVPAASALVTGQADPEAAAEAAIDQISTALQGSEPDLVIFFAKGYGQRGRSIGPQFQQKLSALTMGCSAEAGVMVQGKASHIDEAFALSALAVAMPGLRVYPFHSSTFLDLPKLNRNGKWLDVVKAGEQACVLACSCFEPGADDIHPWLSILDRVIFNGVHVGAKNTAAIDVHRFPVVFGAVTVGREIFIDGRSYQGGGFGVALHGPPGASFGSVVSTGGEPFGPWLQITEVDAASNLVTELNGKNPQEVVEPLLRGPSVPVAAPAGASNLTLAGVFVDATPPSSASSASVGRLALAGAALTGRPNCLLRPVHTFTDEGHLLLSPLAESMPYAKGMQIQLHASNPAIASSDFRSRAEHYVLGSQRRPPDAAVVVSCGTRRAWLAGESSSSETAIGGCSAESMADYQTLQEVWGSTPCAGFFANSQIAPVGLRSYLHERSTVCLTMQGPPAST